MAFDNRCMIGGAGITRDGRVQLSLKASNGTFNWTWFLGNPNLTREMLAIALAAITSGKEVSASMDDPSVAGSEVHHLVLIK